MRTSGVSMPEVVREIITRNRSIYDCMKMDVINFTALAVKIQPDVEKDNGRFCSSQYHSGCNKAIC